MRANLLSFAAAAALVGGLTMAGCKKEMAEPASASEAPVTSGSGTASCTATTTSAQLNQAVQQQIASGGDVQGGDQTIGNTTGNQM